MMDTNQPARFWHRASIAIRFSDLDAMGHVNNATYLTYMEAARVTFAREHGLWEHAPRRVGPILARVCIDYRLPLDLEDVSVDVLTRVSRLGTKSYEMEQQIVRCKADQDEPVAEGQIVLVAYDYEAGQSVRLPEHWVEQMIALWPELRLSDRH